MALYDLSLEGLPHNSPIFTFEAKLAQLRAEFEAAKSKPGTELGSMVLAVYPTETQEQLEQVASVLGALLGERDYNVIHGPREGVDPRTLEDFVFQARASILHYHDGENRTNGDGSRVIALYFDRNNPPEFAPPFES